MKIPFREGEFTCPTLPVHIIVSHVTVTTKCHCHFIWLNSYQHTSIDQTTLIFFILRSIHSQIQIFKSFIGWNADKMLTKPFYLDYNPSKLLNSFAYTLPIKMNVNNMERHFQLEWYTFDCNMEIPVLVVSGLVTGISSCITMNYKSLKHQELWHDT
jgi:hypothetical protein